MGYTYNWNQAFKGNTIGLCCYELCLEIGCFEGLTSNYIVENLLSNTGKLVCVDPLTNNYLNDDLTEKYVNDNETIYSYFNNQYERFIENTKHNSDRIQLFKKLSSEIYPVLLEKYNGQFDLIYIDGDHRTSAVYIDAINCFKLCKNGGIIIFDDYGWGEKYNEDATNIGIDKFLNEYQDQYILKSRGEQVVIQKK